MYVDYYHINTFTDRYFTGNPAGVCILKSSGLSSKRMQQIATELNQPVTAFVTPVADTTADSTKIHEIRWFTPKTEIPLCGHGLLAASFVLFMSREWKITAVGFRTGQNLEIRVTHANDYYGMTLPEVPVKRFSESINLPGANLKPIGVFEGDDQLLLVLRNKAEVMNYIPDLTWIESLTQTGLIITAQGEPNDEFDFVSRYFAPKIGIPEDAATGSTHALLAPCWAKILKKSEFTAYQASHRGGGILSVPGNRKPRQSLLKARLSAWYPGFYIFRD